MALKKRPAKKGRTLSVDMTNAGEGGGRFRIAPGEYRLQCESVKEETSSNDNQMLTWIFKGLEGKAKGKKFFYHTSLVEAALWKLRETLVGLGVEVPEELMDIDLDELEGLEGTAVVDDEEYQGKVYSKIQSFVEAGAEAEEEEEEEEKAPAKKSSANGRKKKVAKTSEDEVNEMDEDDLSSLIDKTGIEVDLSDYKTLSKKRAGVIAALEEAELLEG